MVVVRGQRRRAQLCSASGCRRPLGQGLAHRGAELLGAEGLAHHGQDDLGALELVPGIAGGEHDRQIRDTRPRLAGLAVPALAQSPEVATTTGPAVHLGWPLPLGTPNIGGSLSTRSGLVFIGATQDRYLRAYAADTGRLLWSARLPAGAQATPMTYESTASRRQFVVIAAGGSNTLETRQGDYVVAYALPK